MGHGQTQYGVPCPIFIMNQKLLLATGQPQIDEAIKRFSGFEVIEQIEYRQFCLEAIESSSPDILIIGEGLSGSESIIQIILAASRKHPKLRIVYLAGYVDSRDDAKINSLGMLVMAGVNDIVHEKSLTSHALLNILNNPRTFEQMEYLVKKVNSTAGRKGEAIEFEIPEDENEENKKGTYNNLFAISSIKPGTGKSFLSTNLAAAIAAYGIEVNGRKPRVALIEADLQNLSVGTLLQIEDNKRNLKTVVEKISTIVNERGDFIGELEEMEEVNKFIHDCFKPYHRLKNLEALVGSQLNMGDLDIVKPFHYVYLVESIIDHYDIIIVDTNSSLSHVTTYPLLHMSKGCYYILNLDFNNVRNNVRYQDVLEEIGILDKVKYVLNEDITQDEYYTSKQNPELLTFTADHLDDSNFTLEGRIPTIPKSVFLNRLYEGTPIVLDDHEYTEKARYEILKVANQLWPIKNFEEMEERMNKTVKKKGFFKQ